MSTDFDILSILDQDENPFEALEARRVLETSLVKYAVEHRTTQDLTKMKTALGRLVTSIDSGDYNSLLLADREFHVAIGEATKNSLLEQMLRSLLEIMGQGLWPRLKAQLLSVSKEHMMETRRTHGELFEAVHEQDTEAAVAWTERHFDEIDRLFQGS